MNNKNLIFYNNYHNGDIFCSRNFVKDIINKTDFKNYFYSHNNDKNLLKDIPKLQTMDFLKLNQELSTYEDTENIYVNTWIGREHRKYVYKYGVDFHCIYNIYENVYNTLGIKLENIEYYIPTVDYKYYNIKGVNEFVDNNKNCVKILVSNGDVLSSQSSQFDFNEILRQISKELEGNYLFIMTDDKYRINYDRFFYTSDIIKNNGCDLNEISYLSTFCDIIIGRSSGPYTFCEIQDNKDKIFINICNDPQPLYEQYFNNYNWTNNYNIDNLKNLILEKIKILNIKKIDHFYKSIFGYCNFENIYRYMVRYFPSGSHFVELGSFFGQSTVYLATEIQNSGKKIKFDTVDNWSKENWKENENVFDQFKKNIEPIKNYINYFISDSSDMSKHYEDKSLDFVFIDASHEYDNVKKDIQSWLPKIKSGGFISGHDYCHPFSGVIRAVREEFKNDFIIDNTTWIKKID